MWSWNANTLATWCEEVIHWKRPWCWETLKAGGEGDNRGWDIWMASSTQWTWVSVNSGSWWWTGRPAVLQSMGLQRIGHNWVTELNWILTITLEELYKNLAVAAKLLQLCLTVCDPLDGSPPGSPIPGFLQARTLEWVAIYFFNAWKWKWSCSVMSNSSWPHGLQPTRLLPPWDFPGKGTEVGCHCFLHKNFQRLK